MNGLFTICLVAGGVVIAGPQRSSAQQVGQPVFGRTQEENYRRVENVHKGSAGQDFQELLGGNLFQSNIRFFHRDGSASTRTRTLPPAFSTADLSVFPSSPFTKKRGTDTSVTCTFFMAAAVS